MKHLELAARLFCALVESESPVTPATLWSWDQVRECIAHDQDLLIDIGRLSEAGREKVLRYTGEFEPLESLGQVYVFPDASSAKAFVRDVQESGQVAEMYDETIVHAHADYMDEVATAAVTHGGVPYRGPKLTEACDFVDATLPLDMVQDGIYVKDVCEALIKAVRLPLKQLEEGVVLLQSGEHTDKFKARLETFWQPKDVMGYPAYVVEGLVRAGSLTEAQATELYEAPEQEKPPAATVGQQAADRGGVADQQPDGTTGSAAQSKSEPQQEPDKPTEFRPTEEEGSPSGDVTMPDGTPIPQEILKKAFADFLGQLQTQVQHGTEGGEPQTKADADPEPPQEEPEANQNGSDTTADANQQQAQPPKPPEGAPQGQQQANVPESVAKPASSQKRPVALNVARQHGVRKNESARPYIPAVLPRGLPHGRQRIEEGTPVRVVGTRGDRLVCETSQGVQVMAPPERVVELAEGYDLDAALEEMAAGAPPTEVARRRLRANLGKRVESTQVVAKRLVSERWVGTVRVTLDELQALQTFADTRLSRSSPVNSVLRRAMSDGSEFGFPVTLDMQGPRGADEAWALQKLAEIMLSDRMASARHKAVGQRVLGQMRESVQEGAGPKSYEELEAMSLTALQGIWRAASRGTGISLPSATLRDKYALIDEILELSGNSIYSEAQVVEASPAKTTGSFVTPAPTTAPPVSADATTTAMPGITAKQWTGAAVQNQEESNPANHEGIEGPTSAKGHDIDVLAQNDAVNKLKTVAEGLGGFYDGDAGQGQHTFLVPTESGLLFSEAAASHDGFTVDEGGTRGSYITYYVLDEVGPLAKGATAVAKKAAKGAAKGAVQGAKDAVLDKKTDEAFDTLELTANVLLEQLDTGQEAEAEAAAKAFASAADEIKKLRQATFSLTTDQLVRLTSILQAIGNKPAAGKVEKVRNALAALQDAAKKASDELQKAHDSAGLPGAEAEQDAQNGEQPPAEAPPAEQPAAEAPPPAEQPPAPAPAEQQPPQESVKSAPEAVIAEASASLLRARWKNARSGPFREGQIVWVAPFEESQGEVWVAEDPHSRRGVYAARESVEILERQDPKLAVMEEAVLRVLASSIPECIEEGDSIDEVMAMIRGECFDLPLTVDDIVEVHRIARHTDEGLVERQTMSVSSAVLAELGEIDDPIISRLATHLQDGAPVVVAPVLLEAARVLRRAGRVSLAKTFEDTVRDVGTVG